MNFDLCTYENNYSNTHMLAESCCEWASIDIMHESQSESFIAAPMQPYRSVPVITYNAFLPVVSLPSFSSMLQLVPASDLKQ